MSQSGPLRPFSNLLMLWQDGRWNAAKFRLPGEGERFRFMGAWFLATPFRTHGGWTICRESTGWLC